ncbi:carboxylesterase family protein [Actinomycetes bacterium KLBMP 9759]
MLRRRYPLAAALMAATALLCSCSVAAEPGAAPVDDRVVTDKGEVRGVLDGEVRRFHGIPYAAPPVGQLRWAPPEPPAPWTTPRDATRPGARCAQLPASARAPHATAGSSTEDCLTVSVTIPRGTRTSARLPVLVWLHGGGFNAGAADDVDPQRLADAGPLMVVTVNYRLGIFGFFGLPGLPGSGAFGLQDQQAALRWVQRNAAAFGGDPATITLGGVSAGADSVCAQLTAPGTSGMIARAIMQSGGCGTTAVLDAIRPGTGPAGDTWKPLPQVEAAGLRAAAQLGCPVPAAALACMRGLPADALVGGAGVYWSPAVGSPTLPERPSAVVARGELRKLAILAGTTKDEGTLFTATFYNDAGTPVTDTSFRTMLAVAAGNRSGQAGRAYAPGQRSPGRTWSDVITDRAYACPAFTTYQSLGARAPLFAYEFAEPSATSPFAALPPDLVDSVTHGSELPFLFDLVPGQPDFDDQQAELAAQMVDSWARFVVNGNPSGGGTEWPQWSGDGQLLMFTTEGAGTDTRTGPGFATAHNCHLWT